jgi:hypothetical protein
MTADNAAGARALTAAGLCLDELKAALRAEEAERLSPATQAAYHEAEASGHSSWLEVTDALQRRVLQGHRVPRERMAAALFVLRAAAQLFPHDNDVQSIPLYVRHNRAEQGSLRAGDPLPVVRLHPLHTGATTTLPVECAGRQPVLLVAGSFT